MKNQRPIPKWLGFDRGEAYRNLVKRLEEIRKEEEQADHKFLLEKIQKLTQGKPIILKTNTQAL